ncbi:MAG: hypothetical protein K0Q94_5721 [Paenibacillus sp.]|nr:hypothetical protein [Paenibacillus sp.]
MDARTNRPGSLEKTEVTSAVTLVRFIESVFSGQPSRPYGGGRGIVAGWKHLRPGTGRLARWAMGWARYGGGLDRVCVRGPGQVGALGEVAEN